MTDSQQLLADFKAHGSERAFQELVTRYLDLVYSTALRLVDGDTHRAQDVAQTVFVDLARRAAKLSPNTMLGGWLHRHTCFVARTMMRGERRRQAREQQVLALNVLGNHPDPAGTELALLLDEAIEELGPDDRDAILLRFFEGRNLRSVGEALGMSENVAQKRVARAVQELGTLLKQRGLAVPAAALAGGLVTEAGKAAPVGLGVSVTKAALANAGASAGIGAPAAKIALLTKLKAGVVGILVVAGLTTAFLLQQPAKAKRVQEPQQSSQPLPDSQPADSSANASPSQTAFSPPLSQTPPPTSTPTTEPPSVPEAKTGAIPLPSSPTAVLPQQTDFGSAGIQTARFYSRSGSRLVIKGTSNIHDWQVESPFIGGSIEVGPTFPTEPGQAATPGKVDAKAEVFVSVRSLKSVEKDGKPYSDKMDEIMWEKLGMPANPRIFYRLSDLTLKEAAKSKDAPYVFDAKGELVIGGATNTVSMPVNVLPLGDKKLKITGSTTVKMTSFKIEPPAPKIALGMIKTGDAVSIQFDWIVAPRTALSTRAQKELVPLLLDLPVPAFKGIPQDLRLSSYVEPLSDQPRPALLVPPGLKNVARESTLASSDKNATAEMLAKLTDGDKEASDQSIFYLRKGTQWVQLDLGSPQEIFAAVVWHAHNSAKVYRDVIVQVADDADFIENVRTLYNNDQDNTSGLGVGTDREYFETYEGKLINAQGAVARYLRFYSKGSTESALNEYTEIEVYGLPAP